MIGRVVEEGFVKQEASYNPAIPVGMYLVRVLGPQLQVLRWVKG
jgi:hypothetical protein